MKITFISIFPPRRLIKLLLGSAPDADGYLLGLGRGDSWMESTAWSLELYEVTMLSDDLCRSWDGEWDSIHAN